MQKSKIPLAKAAVMLRTIEKNLDTWVATCPDFVEKIGGRAALAARCEMTHIGPMPTFTEEEFDQIASEYGGRMGWCNNRGE